MIKYPCKMAHKQYLIKDTPYCPFTCSCCVVSKTSITLSFHIRQ